MDAALIRLRTVEKLRLSICAEAIGVSELVCRNRARELGINAKLVRGRPPAPDRAEALERRRRLQREWKAADRQRRPEHYRQRGKQAAD